MTESGDPRLTWVEEMPVPAGNVFIHFQSYVLEQWLRRIALAALMAKAGADWVEASPPAMLPEAKKQVNTLRKRTFIDPENSDNMIWALTVEQLRRILTAGDLSPFVYHLTGVSRRDLDRELQLFREIRNTVAHHRATNEVALQNFRLVHGRLNKAVEQFRRRVLYRDMVDTDMGTLDVYSYELEDLFHSSGLAQGREFALADHDPFYEIQFVSGDPELGDGFVDVGNLLDLLHEIRYMVLCVLLPHAEESQSEVSVVWPKDLSPAHREAVRDRCLLIRQETEVPYAQQDPKHICDPLIWFERSRRWARTAGLENLDRLSKEIFRQMSEPDDEDEAPSD